MLLVEDEQHVADSIISYLQQEGNICEWAMSFEDADERIAIYQYDCALIDITLPGGSGLDLIQAIKSHHPDTGIIIISAKGSLEDKINGLDLGADDYLSKPFHLAELNSRIKSILRRRKFGGNKKMVVGNLIVSPDEQTVEANGDRMILTRKEYDLLLFFISNQNRMLTKEAIAEHLWGDHADMMDSFDFIYSHIKNLRKKLEDCGCREYVSTVYGVGYKFSIQ